MRFAYLFGALFLTACASIYPPTDSENQNKSAAAHDVSNCIDHEPLPETGVVIEHDQEPILIKRIDPDYPRIARQAGITGTVTLSVLVDRCGTVREAAIDKSSGMQNLDDAALGVIRKWKFQPAEYQHSPVAVWTKVPVEFQLP